MKSVLIVDDSRTSRRFLSDILERAGYKIVGEAVNGQEGFDQYVKLHPDIVTMDITMPVMDGIDALKLIKRNNPDAKVVMITAAGQKEKMMEALKIGAVEFVSKPFIEEAVLDALKRC
ncbi:MULTISPECIES: response regulator [Butyrivibrio]|jgi:two-component system chemotaxis response regulator CheY|uniref:Stage 0 sporulation protein A homolog n=1 Tax=Butyrivibrio proteoclasticus TaxID=43305 RepID=A0A1I5WFZ2_9FIRM|nr:MULTISPECIES: response regulator [Butyrivibrio]MBQ6416546.1 response regulator [Butyrivibrio sp.]MBQ9304276.1 response regulator [Butyrivibrio sp.]SFQ18519.1 two-component system, chemotaxis family, response regulator CheY [Butyrivibrio proteoclasticus]